MAIDSGENNLGIVSECLVTDCTYNREKRCTAGGIYINTANGAALYYDCTTESLKPITQEREEVEDVSQCTVIDCSYNKGQSCIAEFITVFLSNNTARCDTYTK
ncbi:DUF1540 domain-containing protein [Myxosarcina sp. GI1]|uniref:DUF1540 domain-containing protein n=1 Tax=Myxosarcina sp. GI1 TaxID=1541065 RepID=UPI000559D920|nr:DUF1540 domain-containing protein [Myxosarcina sp. GI1]